MASLSAIWVKSFCLRSPRSAFSSFSNSSSTSRCWPSSISMAFVSSFSFMSDCAPSANEVQHDADERQHDQNVDGRRGDVKDAESRDPGDEQDDSQPKQHVGPFRRAPRSRSAPRLVCGCYENNVGTTARLARSMARWRIRPFIVPAGCGGLSPLRTTGAPNA